MLVTNSVASFHVNAVNQYGSTSTSTLPATSQMTYSAMSSMGYMTYSTRSSRGSSFTSASVTVITAVPYSTTTNTEIAEFGSELTILAGALLLEIAALLLLKPLPHLNRA